MLPGQWGRGVVCVRREPETGVSGGQAALAVIIVAGIGVTALLLRPDSTLLGKGRGPLGHDGGIVLLIAFGWPAAGLWLNHRLRDRILPHRHLATAEQRLEEMVRRALAVIPFAVPFAVLVLHRFSPHHSATDRDGQRFPLPTLTPMTPPAKRRHGAPHPPGWVSDLLLAFASVLALALVGYAVWVLWRLLRPPVRRKPYTATYATSDDEQELLAQAVDSGRRALLGGDDARAAVIACYAAMEESLAASGVARRASDSPQDLLERTVSGGLLTAGAAGALTALFREARYSTHPMDGGHRDRAAAALADIADQLDRRAAAAAEGPS